MSPSTIKYSFTYVTFWFYGVITFKAATHGLADLQKLLLDGGSREESKDLVGGDVGGDGPGWLPVPQSCVHLGHEVLGASFGARGSGNYSLGLI